MPIIQLTIPPIVISSLSVSILGNLTTIFTPPASCLTPCIFPQDAGRADVALIGSACSYSGNAYSNCDPSSFNKAVVDFPIYSPGICPDGFTTACSPLSEFSLATSITAQVCCPTGFQCQRYEYTDDYSAHCFSYVPVSSYITPIFLETPASATSPYAYTSATAYPVNNIATVAYPGITIAWEATDTAVINFLKSSSSISISTSTSVPTTSTSTSTRTSTSTSTSTSGPSSGSLGGLSASAKVGIGIGASMGITLIAVGVGIYVWRLKRALNTLATEATGDGFEKAELPADEKNNIPPVELSSVSNPIFELPSNEGPGFELGQREETRSRRSREDTQNA
ncbi:hypothetical protein AOQ84DRAFT_420548 [Glonium stellatum]|uniref:Uncharacterized protein n=1 Tax=Glonium stellatum TaxID=574774 RepID=A0A8E2EQN1_9PEZI|nr:hypothetical protein AOQ84DRAFT_420548 [Glonium stellatum]